jgi:hypothetical protein
LKFDKRLYDKHLRKKLRLRLAKIKPEGSLSKTFKGFQSDSKPFKGLGEKNYFLSGRVWRFMPIKSSQGKSSLIKPPR